MDSSSIPCSTRHSVASDGAPFPSMPILRNLFRLCLPNAIISERPTWPEARPSIISIMMSARQWRIFPLPALRKSGTEVAKSISSPRMLPRNLDLFCNFVYRFDAYAPVRLIWSGAFMGETITVPSDLVRIVDGKASACGHLPAVPVMVFYHDSLSCSSCQISHLADIQSIYELSDSLGTFEVMTIFSPRLEEYDQVLRDLEIREFEYPVYLDVTGSFVSPNGCIPSDRRFHSFLTDSDRHPVFVGSPISGDRLWELFEQALERIGE